MNMNETYNTTNGWTKDDMIAHILCNFKGISAKVNCENNLGFCLYRGPNGRKCAVGMFIPDKLYQLRFEDVSAQSVLCDEVKLEKLMPLNIDGMTALQNVHDNYRGHKASEDSDEKCLADMIDWIEGMVKDA